jgi:hypothetical protein
LSGKLAERQWQGEESTEESQVTRCVTPGKVPIIIPRLIIIDAFRHTFVLDDSEHTIINIIYVPFF